MLMILCLDQYYICQGAQFQSHLTEESSLKPPFPVTIYYSEVLLILMALPLTWAHQLLLLLIYSDTGVLFGQLD